jgi:cytochrome P450
MHVTDSSCYAAPQRTQEIRKEFGEELTMEALNKMDKLHRCVKEALRMYPPLLFVMRKVIKPFTYKDYYVPEGARTPSRCCRAVPLGCTSKALR